MPARRARGIPDAVARRVPRLVVDSEGRDVCYAHLAEIGNGGHLASWGLDLLSGRPEATAILDGMIDYIRKLSQ